MQSSLKPSRQFDKGIKFGVPRRINSRGLDLGREYSSFPRVACFAITLPCSAPTMGTMASSHPRKRLKGPHLTTISIPLAEHTRK